MDARSITSRIVVGCVFLALLRAASAQGALFVVDAAGGPGSDATSIGAAIAVAPPAATILVRSGLYAPFAIDGQTVIVVAEPGGHVTVAASQGVPSSAAITVHNLPPGQVVVIEGLSIDGSVGIFEAGTDAVEISNCGGQVWLQDCTVQSGAGPGSVNHALRVTGSDQVLVVRTTVLGGSYLQPPSVALIGAGLHAEASRVFAWNSSFTGGAGGAGAELFGGLFTASACSLEGGTGVGVDVGFGCYFALNGGPGLVLATGSPTAILQATTLAGGPPDIFNGCSSAGPASGVVSGSLQQLAGTPVALDVTSPFLDGTSPQLTLTGAPGDVALMLMATAIGPASYFAKYQGTLATGAPLIFTLGALPPSGTLGASLHFGDALPAHTGSTFFLQAATLKAGGGGQLGGATAVTSWDD